MAREISWRKWRRLRQSDISLRSASFSSQYWPRRMAPHKSHPLSECTRSPCPFYPRIRHMVPTGTTEVEEGRQITTNDYEALSSSTREDYKRKLLDREVLCDFRVHLPLYHLLLCMRNGTLTNFPPPDLRPLSATQGCQGCNFCRMVANMFASGRWDRWNDIHIDDRILMYAHVSKLDHKYKRTVLPSHLGNTDLLFMTFGPDSLDYRPIVKSKRYAIVNLMENEGNIRAITELGGSATKPSLNRKPLKKKGVKSSQT